MGTNIPHRHELLSIGVGMWLVAWYVLYTGFHLDAYWCALGVRREENMELPHYDPETVYWQCMHQFHQGAIETWVKNLKNGMHVILFLVGTAIGAVGLGIITLAIILSFTSR